MPAGNPFIENFDVSVTFLVEHAISQTGQVMRASSIQDRHAIPWNALDVIAKMLKRGRYRS
jgi:hypothetical protein